MDYFNFFSPFVFEMNKNKVNSWQWNDSLD